MCTSDYHMMQLTQTNITLNLLYYHITRLRKLGDTCLLLQSNKIAIWPIRTQWLVQIRSPSGQWLYCSTSIDNECITYAIYVCSSILDYKFIYVTNGWTRWSSFFLLNLLFHVTYVPYAQEGWGITSQSVDVKKFPVRDGVDF